MRRTTDEARFEMTPLLDVVFLLLTFFIYAMAVMVRADVLNVALSPVAGAGGAGAAPEHVLSIRADGGFAYNGNNVEPAALDPLLAELADDPQAPTLYVALEAEGTGDRGPVVWSLLQRLENSGLQHVSIIGTPAE